ncbi:MAG: helicase-related protein [Chloroflexota bacterium]
MDGSEDSGTVEAGALKFVEWLRAGKLQIRAYPAHNLHAKLYIMTFTEGDKDVGRVITGSSNFTAAGLIDNLEFNVELKDRADYDFALGKFNELWANAVDVSTDYIATIQTRTWLNDSITPYELYLKFLYEYFREKINLDQETLDKRYLPENFLDLQYQAEAVADARSKLEEYGGVFISDVVGLGKTYISAMLANQLDGRNLVIAPPVLLDRDNPGSWPSVFSDFRVPADFESLGKLESLIEKGTDRYRNVFVDEAHRFRSETTQTYEMLAQICRGKRVILVTATPLNNQPRDILSQVKLFQKARKSTIPNVTDLEAFFSRLEKKLNGLDRQKDYEQYMRVVSENAVAVRERVLKYIMVRRTRSEITRYFADDLKTQGFKFPEVADPEAVFYQLNDNEDSVFNKSMELAIKQFNYARYTPMLYYQGPVTQPEQLAQFNMRRFMKILLVKRLESSFYAFRRTLERFIRSYEQFIAEYDRGSVYVSKRYASKLFDLLESDDDYAIQRLIDEDKAQRYEASDFKPEYRRDLEHDLKVLKDIAGLWQTVKRDPKLMTFVELLASSKLLRENKLIVFTESMETAEYIHGRLRAVYPGKTFLYTGGASAADREEVAANFDKRARYPRDDYRVLVTTEVLSEGVNLHRSNVVINYDIPWNPARMMQRVGRINRVDTKFDTIYTYNFFPTRQSNDLIKLKEAAQYKIQAFIEMLGADARLLTEGEEIKSHDLFARLTSKKSITGEDETEESELKYLQVIREVRDRAPDLFDRIKKLPRKARSGRVYDDSVNSLLTYFCRGKLQKFYQVGTGSPQEIDFMAAAKVLEAEAETKRERPGDDYFDLLARNKQAFEEATTEEIPDLRMRGGRDAVTHILKVLKTTDIRECKEFTEDDQAYCHEVIRLLEEGALPRQTIKTLSARLQKEIRPLRILAQLRRTIRPEFFKDTMAEVGTRSTGPREVILSEYLVSRP